jgi:hypothetical protein
MLSAELTRDEIRLTSFSSFHKLIRLFFAPSPRNAKRAPNREKAGGEMQTQWTQHPSETDVIARLLAQMEHAKRQTTDSSDADDDLETWEWEGGAIHH